MLSHLECRQDIFLELDILKFNNLYKHTIALFVYIELL